MALCSRDSSHQTPTSKVTFVCHISDCLTDLLSICLFLNSRKVSASRRDPSGPRYDKKYLVFGEKVEEGRYEYYYL